MNEKEDPGKIYDIPMGGYRFTIEDIESKVPEGITGVYLLSTGARSSRGNLFVDYVGRAVATDFEDLRKRLLAHLRNAEEQIQGEGGERVSIYKWFWFYCEENDEEAYRRECLDYHKYNRIHALLNKIHPAKRPDHPDDQCPEPGCYN